MSLLARLLGKRPDPTKDWAPPLSKISVPPFDLGKMQFGPVRFGDPLEAARAFGRPNSFFCHPQSDYCELLYSAAGFQIDSDEGRIAYLAFFISADPYTKLALPKGCSLQYSKPQLQTATALATFTANTQRLDLENLLGRPAVEDTDEDEKVRFYEIDGLAMEFEFDFPSGRLKRWNLYTKKAE